MLRLAVLIPSLFAGLVAVPAHAVYHIAVIDEVMSGANGNPAVQYVEIRTLLSGQNAVCHSKLTVFKCQADGGGSQVLIADLGGPSATNTPPCLPNGGAGVRWIMASPSGATFLAASGITPDFTWDNTVTGNIPTSCGMVCWGAPGSGIVPPQNPPTWDATNPFNYVDCVAYGSYDGTAEPVGSAPATDTPGNGTLSLNKTDTTAFSNAFQLACPTPENDAGAMGNFGACSTTTTTVTTSTTTTTLPGKSKCTAKELSAAGKKALAKAKCLSKAVTKGEAVPPDSPCLATAQSKFSTAYGKATNAGDCRTMTSAGTVETKVDAFISDLGATLVGASTGPSKCTGKELAAAGKKAAAKIKCHSKAVGKGVAVDSGCLTTAGTKFGTAYGKATGAGDCINGTDAATVEGKVDAFVNDLKATLAP